MAQFDIFMVVQVTKTPFNVRQNIKFFTDKEEAIRYASRGKDAKEASHNGRCLASFEWKIHSWPEDGKRQTHVFQVQTGSAMLMPRLDFDFARYYWEDNVLPFK